MTMHILFNNKRKTKHKTVISKLSVKRRFDEIINYFYTMNESTYIHNVFIKKSVM
jgi:hypothetical protein